jgi:hypothetical protein
MVTTPAVMPVTTPEDVIVAIAGDEDDQVPPAVGSVSNVLNPTHILCSPDIAPGEAFTVTVLVVEQVPRE